jgi:isocitrate dehydrogenase
MTTPVEITVARGDGIGPEIMDATLKILEAAGAKLKIEEIEVGESVFKRGIMSGIEDASWDSLYRTKVFLKAPITTPQGGGYKSLNVTCRKTLGLYANVRQCVSYHPFVETHFPKMDMVIVRENEEDLYAGIEYQRTPDVMVGLKVITRQGSEKIIRYAFEYARTNGRKKVTCMSKDNIMKMCDGLFHKTFDAVAAEYPDIQNEHYIVDIGAARIASRPQDFDVVVTENLYGDILSDIAAEITGSVGLGGSCNIGPDVSMFEAVHGSAPDIAGKGLANPSGLVLASIMMLTHIGQNDVATRIHNAWLKTIEDGIHTGDIYREQPEGKRNNDLMGSQKRVGTAEFTAAVIERLGQKPTKLTAVDYGTGGKDRVNIKTPAHTTTPKKRVGADVFVTWTGDVPEKLASEVTPALPKGLSLKMLTNRGLKAWPGKAPTCAFSSLWALRIMADDVGADLPAETVAGLHAVLAKAGLDIASVETLFHYNDKPGYTAAQGE